MGFFGDGEHAVIDSGQIQLVQNRSHFFLFLLRFMIRNVPVVIDVGIRMLEAFGRAHEIRRYNIHIFALAVPAIAAQKAPLEWTPAVLQRLLFLSLTILLVFRRS